MEQYYTISELTELLKISDSTIRRYIKSGDLKTEKIGRQHRITEASVKIFFEKQRSLGDENK